MSEPVARMLAGFDYASSWLHGNHWDSDEVEITQAGEPGAQNLGTPVPTGQTRRVREVTARNEGSGLTVVTLYANNQAILSFVISSNDAVTWTSEDGRELSAGQQLSVRVSSVLGGNVFVSAAGVEA